MHRILTIVALFAVVLIPAQVASAQDNNCDIIGTEGNDVLIGTAGNDRICGLGGDDIIRSGRGNDVVFAGAGNDRVIAGPGHDIVHGGSGNDQLWGRNGRDRLFGQQGNDSLDGGGGRDRLRGGPGSDECADPRGKTNERGCEATVDVALQRWAELGATEYVYTASLDDDGFGYMLVRVRDGEVISPADDPTALTGEQLIEATRGSEDVRYDPTTGLPSSIQNFERRDLIRSALEAAREQWGRRSVDTYDFTFRVSCFCPGPIDIDVSVVDGVIEALEAEESLHEPKTMDEHFDTIARLLDDANVSVNARFDEAFGHPTSYGFDASRLIADEEQSVAIFDFVALEAGPIRPAPDDGITNIVTVEGIEVDDSIAESLAALLAAATADGLNLSGGGYRDPAAQIAIRRVNCGPTDFDIFEKPASQCSPPTAIPGQSLHETGLAVDFTNNGRLVTSRTDVAFIWLDANAADFGLFNHPREPWHWSINGN